MGQRLLYWWPDEGWQRGTVARLCPRGAFSHVVAYTRQTSALRGTADTLLDAASYGAPGRQARAPGRQHLETCTRAISRLIPGYPGISRPLGYPFLTWDNFQKKSYPGISQNLIGS